MQEEKQILSHSIFSEVSVYEMFYVSFSYPLPDPFGEQALMSSTLSNLEKIVQHPPPPASQIDLKITPILLTNFFLTSVPSA